MKPEREGVIGALLTDEERAEMPTPESRQWYDHKAGWRDDYEGAVICPLTAYRPRPKSVKAWQDEFEAWARNKTIIRIGEDRPFRLIRKIGMSSWSVDMLNFDEKGASVIGQITIGGYESDIWGDTFHEAEEYVEPYAQDTLPWPLVVGCEDGYGIITAARTSGVFVATYGNMPYSELAKLKTPTGEPCGIRKWRKKA